MLGLFLILGSAIPQGSTLRASVNSQGEQAHGDIFTVALSNDGRYVTFASSAPNLVAGSIGQGIFVHDRVSGATTLESVSSSGVQANQHSYLPALSFDARFVAFGTAADNLVPDDRNGVADVYVRDRETGQTTRVSVDSSGAEANGDSWEPSLSDDGRFVAFWSFASNLVLGDTNGLEDVFVHDRVTGTTVCASVDSSGNPSNGMVRLPRLSGDGRFVTFSSWASNLVPGDTNGEQDVFVHDLTTRQTSRVSVSSTAAQANGPSQQPSLSHDGRYVSFNSGAGNLVPGDTNGCYDVFVHDRQTGTTTRESLATGGAQADGDCWAADISDDGRYVSFYGFATNLGPTLVGISNVFVRDRVAATTWFASVSSAGFPGDGASWYPPISGDGSVVAFPSDAGNLVPLDTNGTDAFVHVNAGCEPRVRTYCTAGTTSHGCVPAISGTGVPSLTAGSGFVVTVDRIEGQKSGIVLFGIAGPAVLPWNTGSSSFCVALPIKRGPMTSGGGTAGACDGQLAFDWNAFIAAHPFLPGHNFIGGETVWAQGWFRDVQAPGGSNLSDALWFDVCP